VTPATSFVFDGNVTRAFDYAWIKTRKNSDGSRSPIYVIMSQATSNAHIKVRLQGIDAPELHYRRSEKGRSATELGQASGVRAPEVPQESRHRNDD
jgi:endonuclease YncB( thermonuclease family)